MAKLFIPSVFEVEYELTDLFTDEFMSKNTNYKTFPDMLDNSGYVITSREDFLAIPDDDWDTYVSSCTRFHTWNEMCLAAQNGSLIIHIDKDTLLPH